jgi:DNA-binding Xre family transcriptional regulator
MPPRPPFETYKDKTLVQMKIHANQLNMEIARLREAVAYLGDMGDVCTFDTLGEICSYCRCPRKS